MTEQPPPSAELDLRDWFWRCALNLQNAAIKSVPQIAHPCDADHFANDAMRRVERVCEQRVSAERERCFTWALGRIPRSRACQAIRDGDDPHAVHVPKDPSLCWRCGETLHPGHYCAPAERPAPPQQKEDLPRRIGVEQRTQETDRPVGGAAWQPMDTAPKDGTPVRLGFRGRGFDVIAHWSRGTWRLSDSDEFGLIGRPEPAGWMPLPAPPGVPYALASTGEQPDCGAGWRPIASAPKDGTKVDLWVGNRRYADCRWNYGWNVELPTTRGAFIRMSSFAPTHWRLPPSAPSDIASTGEQPPSPPAVVDYTTGNCPCGYGWNCKETGCRRPPPRDPNAWSDADA